MRFSILFFLYSFASFIQTQASKPVIYIKLNPDDCIICNNNIGKIDFYSSKVKVFLILKKEWERDTTYLEKKLSVNVNKFSHYFSDSLYHVFDKEVGSELIVKSEDKVLYRTALKATNFPYLDKLLEAQETAAQVSTPDNLIDAKEKVIQAKLLSLDSNISNYLCNLTFSRRIRYAGRLTSLIVHDELSENIYNIYPKRKQIDTFELNTDMLDKVYKVHFGNSSTSAFRIANQVRKSNPAARPSITSFGSVNDTGYCLITAFYFNVVGDDTIGHKFFTLIRFTADKAPVFTKIDTPDPDLYGINESNMVMISGNQILFSVIKPQQDRNVVLADFRIKEQSYQFKDYLPTLLPWQYLQSGLNYRSLQPVLSKPYYSFTFSNTIYNTSSKDTFSFPLVGDSVIGQLSRLTDIRKPKWRCGRLSKPWWTASRRLLWCLLPFWPISIFRPFQTSTSYLWAIKSSRVSSSLLPSICPWAMAKERSGHRVRSFAAISGRLCTRLCTK